MLVVAGIDVRRPGETFRQLCRHQSDWLKKHDVSEAAYEPTGGYEPTGQTVG